MKKIFSILLVCIVYSGSTQFLAPYQAVQKQPKLQFDYWVYSTHAGSGSTTQYPANAGSKADMDNIFSTVNSNTTIYQQGRTNSPRILDWQSAAELSTIGITTPNSGTYFAIKVQGTFIPQESGTYTFTLESDDASDFFIEGTSVIGTYSGQAVPALGTHTGIYSVVAGKSYSFTARMQQGGGGFGLRLYWKSPTQAASIASGYTTNWAQNIQEFVSSPDMDGSSSEKAAPSAKYIQTAFNQTADGVYWINLPYVGPTQIYCIMNAAVDGGGWMMAMKATRGASPGYAATTFNFDANYWYTANTLNSTDVTRNDADAKFDVMNYFAAKDIMALWPDISNSGTESGSIDNLTNWSWLQNSFNGGASTTLINFFIQTPTATTFQTKTGTNSNVGITFSGFNSTIFSTEWGYMFYGFNYTGNSAQKVRWGFSFKIVGSSYP